MVEVVQAVATVAGVVAAVEPWVGALAQGHGGRGDPPVDKGGAHVHRSGAAAGAPPAPHTGRGAWFWCVWLMRVSSFRVDGLRSLANCRLLAVDLGARYIGLAARTCRLRGPQPCGLVESVPRRAGHRDSDGYDWLYHRETGVNRNGGAVTRYETQADALAAAIAEERVAAAVVGMPYHADGSRSRECVIVEQHVAKLQAAWTAPLPVLFWDESFSTRRVTGPRRRAPGTRASRGSHSAAACIILEEVVQALMPLETVVNRDSSPADALHALGAPLLERLPT